MSARPPVALVLLLAAAGQPACTVGPDYSPPPASAPGSWSGELAGGVSSGRAQLAGWWSKFGDPALDAVVDRAVRSNHDLRIATQRVREARALRLVAGAADQPVIDAASSYSRDLRSENTDSGIPGGGSTFGGGLGQNTEPTDLYAVGFDATWELDVFGRVRRSVEAADADVAAAEDARRDVLVTLLAEVATNYVDLRSLQARLQIAHSNVAAQSDTLALVDARFQGGLTSELDVAQARLNVERTRSQIPALEASIAQAMHRLGVLVGEYPAALVPELAAARPVPTPPPEIAAGLPSDLLRRRPDVRRAERELAAATARIGVATADLFPRFMLTGSADLQASPIGALFDADSFAYSLGPSVRWNLLDGGRIRGNIRVQDARQAQALASYEQTTLRAFEEVENALVAYARELVRRDSLRLATDAAARAVQLADERYVKGLTDFQNVLDGQRTLFSLQDELAQSDRSVTRGVVALYKALGGGWERLAPEAPPRADAPRATTARRGPPAPDAEAGPP